jgi:hypothetical protein
MEASGDKRDYRTKTVHKSGLAAVVDGIPTLQAASFPKT